MSRQVVYVVVMQHQALSHENLRTIVFTGTFAKKTLMCNTHYFCGDERAMWLNNTQNALLLCHCNNRYVNAPECYVIRT